jgi:hypothetical protein
LFEPSHDDAEEIILGFMKSERKLAHSTTFAAMEASAWGRGSFRDEQTSVTRLMAFASRELI